MSNDLNSSRPLQSSPDTNTPEKPGSSKSNESADDDSSYELCFVVEEIEFLTFKHGFIMHSQYFRDLLANVNDTQIRILLPLWASANAFRVVIDFVNSGEISPNIDINVMQNVLWLADFFQIQSL